MKTSKSNIITFSGRMRSGKGMLCDAMEKYYGAKTFAMATHLKELCVDILNIENPENGSWTVEKLNEWKNKNYPLSEHELRFTPEAISFISSVTGFDERNVQDSCKSLHFNTVRDLLQRVGTDVIRNIDSSWHIRKTLDDILQLPENTPACIEDIRFKNELEFFQKAGANTFFIIRNNAEKISNHVSETQLTHFDFPDTRILINNGNEEEFVDEFVSEYENGFNATIKKSIFLIEFPKYRDVNRNFAMDKTPLIDELVRQNASNDLFVKNGLITFRNNTKFKIKDVLSEMSIINSYEYEQINGRFVIDNPIAYENLKKWMA